MKSFKSVLAALIIVCSALKATSQVPVYNSYPDALATIFLDFDGHTVNGTSWNVSGPINCGASGLNDIQITEVFNRVAEDYRPFNINITTDPAKFLSAPVSKRMRVIVTVTHQWYGSSAGGVAFVGSFTWGDDSPAFVFSQLLNFNVKNIAEASSHEAGHTLGLQHQSLHSSGCVPDGNGNTLLATYNTGTGPLVIEGGEVGWAPIMGAGYYRNMTVWHNGPTPWDCAGGQDDLSIITTTLSPANPANGYRADDHTNAFNTSTWANFSNNQFTVNGVIETASDQDLFRFTLPSNGRFRLNAVPYNVGTGNAGSDVDLSIQLLNSAQVVVNTYNPGTLLNSIIDSVMNAGTYYLRVDGKGNQFAPEYGSIGSYSLQGNFAAGNPLPLRVLQLNGNGEKDKHNLSWVIDADEIITDLSVEMSRDGIRFQPLIQTGADARSFSYKPYTAGTLQYRLNVTFDNGRQYYSNVVTIKQAGTAGPKLVGTLVPGPVMKVSSPGNFEFEMNDLSGKTVQKGRLTAGLNTINISGLINGLYLVRFTDGEHQWNEKFVRQ